MNAPREPASRIADSPERTASSWPYPVYLIKQADAFYALWGEVRGQDVTGVPVFADKSLAQEQVEQDAIEATVVQVDSASIMKPIAAKLVDAWFFYFHNCEAEMAAVKASRVA